MPIPQRPRTPRYLVAKWDDIHQALSAREVHTLISMLTKISQNRTARNLASTRQYVVVSDKNRQMYDEVWGMVLAEIESSQETQARQVRDALARMRQSLDASQSRQQVTVDPEQMISGYTDEVEEAEDEDFALESAPSPSTGQWASRPNVSLAEAEQSLQSAWTATNEAVRGVRANEIQAISSSSGRSVSYAQWQPAAVWINESDDREPANIAAFDLETYG